MVVWCSIKSENIRLNGVLHCHYDAVTNLNETVVVTECIVTA